MLVLFLLSWLAQSVAGLTAYNSVQLQDPVRQRGSPESKPVGAAHVVTDRQG